MKQLKSDIQKGTPLFVELIIFFTYLFTLQISYTKLYWGLITTVFIFLLVIILMYIRKTKRLKKIRDRLIIHVVLNLLFLILLLASLILSLKELADIVYFFGIALNILIEVDFIFYLGMSEKFSNFLSSTLSLSFTFLLVITSFSIGFVSQDNWVIIGLIGAFLNHILNPNNLLAAQNRSEEEIQIIMKEYNLDNKFWILKGIGLSIILSWAASIFVFNDLSYNGEPIPQIAIIISCVYICIILAFIIHFIFSKVIIEIEEKHQKKAEIEKEV